MNQKQAQTHFISTVRLGSKGQIVIPKEIRDMFGLKIDDPLVIMADLNRGIAIHRQEVMQGIAQAIFAGNPPILEAQSGDEELRHFAEAIEGATRGEGQ